MTPRQARRPLATKLTRMNMLVSAGALLLACVAFAIYEVATFREVMAGNLSIQAQMAGSNSASAIVFNDTESARRALAALEGLPDVLSAEILTPSLETGILSGITRELVLEIARAAGVPAREDRLPEARLREAEEIFLTSTTREILPVVRLDSRPIGDGRPGPLTRRLRALFRERVRAAAPVS